jgi:hypothetical protein
MIGRYVWRPTRSHTLATGGGVGQSENIRGEPTEFKALSTSQIMLPSQGDGNAYRGGTDLVTWSAILLIELSVSLLSWRITGCPIIGCVPECVDKDGEKRGFAWNSISRTKILH